MTRLESNAATKKAHTDARALAALLFQGPCTDVRPPANPTPGVEPTSERCFAREEKRLTRAEKARGWVRRPWSHYSVDHLCRNCLAYWHAEMAAITLDEAVKVGASVVNDDAMETPKNEAITALLKSVKNSLVFAAPEVMETHLIRLVHGVQSLDFGPLDSVKNRLAIILGKDIADLDVVVAVDKVGKLVAELRVDADNLDKLLEDLTALLPQIEGETPLESIKRLLAAGDAAQDKLLQLTVLTFHELLKGAVEDLDNDGFGFSADRHRALPVKR